ncbi:DUF2029 domain-containing protein [bacterium]|nr:DUF2029 domain-containing protein [candidate division CSSED10-310 bacterium]
MRRENTSPVSMAGLLLAVLVAVRLYRYPAFFYPRDPTMFDRLPDWIHRLLGAPSNALVNNPIALALVSTATGLVLLFLLLDFFRESLPTLTIRNLRAIILGMLIAVTVAVPVAWEMLCRHQTEPHRFAHDGGVIQTEEAVRMVLSGRNPYRETYHDTPMRDYAGDDRDPPLFHWPYLPFFLLIGTPVQVLFQNLFHWFDMRLVYFVFYLWSIGITARLAGGEEDRRLSAVVLFALNPFLIPFLVEGRNDIVPLALILAAVLAAVKKHDTTAVFLTALACCSKQFAWLFIPYMAAYLGCFKREGFWARRRKYAPWFLLPGILLIGPFLVWDFPVFWDDIIAFNAGHTEMNYLIGGTPGYGASNYLLTWQSVASRTQYYPFWIWQVLGAGPLLVLSVLRVHRRPTPANLLCGYAITLFAFIYLSRLMHDNYLGFIIGLLVVGVLSPEPDPATG